jgi:hypothetical protein
MKIMREMQLNCKKPSRSSRNFLFIKASLTSKILYAGVERAFVQQNRVAMFFLLFCFCQLFDLFECHGQPRNIVKDQIDESTKHL